MKIRKNPGKKIPKPDEFPEKKTLISYMRSKSSILWLLKYEDLRSAPSKKKEKKIKLRSFAHELKTKVLQLVWCGICDTFFDRSALFGSECHGHYEYENLPNQFSLQ